MGHTTCTEPQYLYKGALYLYLYLAFQISATQALFKVQCLEILSVNLSLGNMT